MNRRSLFRAIIGSGAAVGVTMGVKAEPTYNNADHWLITCEKNGHGIWQAADASDFYKHAGDLYNNECGICGSRFFDGPLTHFRTGWRVQPLN